MARSNPLCVRNACGTTCSRHFATFSIVAALVAAVVGTSASATAQEALLPGQAFVTEFSGTTTATGTDGVARTVIDANGASGVAIDLRAPGFAPDGRHWIGEPHLFAATAGDVGQVFGVALDDAPAPNIYLTATALFGLHRNADNSGWMEGMWGRGGGPGTVYRLNAANGYRPEVFAEITLDGRFNSGAALGNIAFDRWHQQFYVSDLETGNIHRIGLADGADLGRFDHGVSGRSSFFDAVTGASAALPPVAFDPASSAHIFDCPTGDFARTVSCWNMADFRRRVFGLGVRRDATTGEVRLYYSVWSSQGFGNPAWATAGDEQKNTLWSVAIGADGDFDRASVRREAVLPDFFVAPEDIARSGYSHPVADIAFPAFGDQTVMLLAERGGVRNLGLNAEDAFATPHEARVLRYEIDAQGVWQPVGRYDVGFYDRQDQGTPYIRANAAGGVAFGFGYDAGGAVDPTRPDAFVWMTGDGLCSPAGPCFNPATGLHDDQAEVHGIEGRDQAVYEPVVPDAAFQPYPSPGPATPATGPDSAFMVDTDVNIDGAAAVIPEELGRNDATRIGDIAIFEAEPKRPDLEIVKRATSAHCDPDAECAFEAIITNVGEVPYTGPLMVRDTIGAGGALVDHAPSSPDGWDCQEVFSGTYQCGFAAVSLAPGESTSLSMTVKVPEWWTQASYSNCAELITPDATVDERSYNNLSCGYVAICTPGTPGCDFDLALTKFGLDGQCDWLGHCHYVVRITNVGAADYSGPLAFHDSITQPGTALADFAPRPDWICGPGGATAFDCVLPAVTLAPGEFREVSLSIAGPPLAAGHTHVRNCAWIDWRGAERDAHSGNEYDCSEISRFPPGHPEAAPLLSIEKDGSLVCSPDDLGTWGCYYTAVITNIGGAPYFGPFEIVDASEPVPAIFEDYLYAMGESMVWTCDPGEGAQLPQTCSRPPVPGGLQPGQSVSLSFRSRVPAGDPPLDRLWNCATLRGDHDGAGEQTSCFQSLLCERGTGNCPKDLGIIKHGMRDPCFPGFSCPFWIDVYNLSDEDYPGPVVVTDTPVPGFGTPVVEPPGSAVTCVPAGDNLVCTHPDGLAGGGFFSFGLDYSVPSDLPSPAFKNCANVPPGPNNEVAENDEDCWTNFVPFPDLDISGGTECYRDEECTLDVNIANRGKLPFVGAVGARGTIAPAVPIDSITSLTPGLSCRVTGVGAYECRSDRLDLAPDASADWQIRVTFGLDYPADEATHTKTIFWPDRNVKDIRPENDEDVSTITILGPQEAQAVQAPPQPPPAAATAPAPAPAPAPSRLPPPDLAIAKIANQSSCIAGRTCPFAVTVTNVGAGTYVGPIHVADVAAPANAALSASDPRWSCRKSGSTTSCTYPTATLAPGASLNLSLSLTPPRTATGSFNNCASLAWNDTTRTAIVQHALNQLGFDAGPVDGKVGPRTHAAVHAFEGSAGLPVTGQISPALLQSLFGTWGGGDANAANDEDCAGVVLQTPAAPTIVCEGGTVRNEQCICLPGATRVQTATNAWRCETPRPVTTCVGGTIQGNRCVCPTGTESQPAGPGAWRCVATTPSLITCTGGSVVNNQCVCPQGTIRRQTATNSYRCETQAAPSVPPTIPQLTCQGGTIQQGRCVCPAGTERTQVLPGVFRCQTVAPSIQCGGGKIENNQCICPQGMEAQLRATNIYKCVPSAPAQTPPIQCSGGSVENNQCVCPQGMQPRKVSDRVYRCVQSEAPAQAPPPQQPTVTPSAPPAATAPSITCTGGSVQNGKCVCPVGTRRESTGANAYRCTPLIRNPLQQILPRLLQK